MRRIGSLLQNSLYWLRRLRACGTKRQNLYYMPLLVLAGI